MVTSFADHVLDTIIDDSRSAISVINELYELGYTNNFRLIGNELLCTENRKHYQHRSFCVDEIYRFRFNPGSNNGFSIFALHHPEENLKGVFIAIGIAIAEE